MTAEAGSDVAPATDDVFAGGGEMGALMRTVDWAATPIGGVEGWPQSLRTALSICLASRFPMLIWWGPKLVMLYNDAYRPMLGVTKHPRSMGQAGKECWPEIWDIIGPMLHDVFDEGRATWSDDQLLLLDRNGYVEECYFTFSYSPIRDESGGVGGVFTAVTETTERVIGERRLRLLQELATRTGEARTVEEVCDLSMATLAGAAVDIPFALLYTADVDGRQARLVCSAGLPANSPAAPAVVDLEDPAAAWPLATVLRTGRMELVKDIPSRLGVAGSGSGPALASALVLPVPQAGQATSAALLVAGVSPHRALDEGYLSFFRLVAGQIASAISGARAHEDERKRTEALAELDRAKTAFFSNVSHEFRTPLTLLLGPLEAALADPNLPAEQRERLAIAQRNGLRLLKLVNMLLDFSRIEAGRIQAVYEPVDLASWTAELASLFRSAAEAAGLCFLVNCPALPEPVYVDGLLWEKIVFNLLSNAIKFTFQGEIEVSVRSAGAHVELEVRDTGTGIPAQELPHLFTRFHRVRGARARTHEGAGIGLALAHDLVHLHGGTMRVERTVGEGSRFTVSLPLGSAHLPADQVQREGKARPAGAEAAAYIEEVWQWARSTSRPRSDVEGDSPAETSAAAGARSAGPSGWTAAPRLLVADDNADMRDYLVHLLRDRYALEVVPDGVAALHAARADRPDLILADIMMPRLDGLALLRALRADPGTATIPVVLLSARAGEEAAVEGLRAGADDYLIKPFSAQELLARVRVHVDMSRAREEIERERDEFLSAVAHDLRTPLTAIKGFTQILQRLLKRHGMLDAQRAADPLRLIDHTATRLTQMIAELQDITLIGPGRPL
ncbi:MAG: response regulator, partial [Chloroflexi bacterium]|nr:response regulator [Chloroflexota bacterium]